MDARWASVKGLDVTNCKRMPFLSLKFIYIWTLKNSMKQVFVIRPLSIDMDLQVYNNMLIKVQHNPKYVKDYFPSSTGQSTANAANNMVTG